MTHPKRLPSVPDFFQIYDRVCKEHGTPFRIWDAWQKAHRQAIRVIVDTALEEAAKAAEGSADVAQTAGAIRKQKFSYYPRAAE